MKKFAFTIIFISILCLSAFAQTQSEPNCPTISITGPSSIVQSGENITFTLNINGVEPDKIEYQWSVDKGTIIEGQGMSIIIVSTEGFVDTIINATVQINGLPQGCTDSISETGIVAPGCGWIPPVDEYGKLSGNDEKARLNVIVTDLKKNSDIAYIILYHPLKDGKKSYENRVARIKKFLITDNKIQSERIVIIFGSDEPEERTRIYLLPPDVEPPTP